MGSKRTRAKKRKNPTLAYTGDHGTGTAAAMAGTVLEPLQHDGKPDPNRRARRRRTETIEALKFLDMRQLQAAQAIRNAYCKVQMLSSGSPLKEQVDASPKPDAVIAAQIDAMSRLKLVMDAVPWHFRETVEAICWHNQPIRSLRKRHDVVKSEMQGAMTCVADALRY